MLRARDIVTSRAALLSALTLALAGCPNGAATDAGVDVMQVTDATDAINPPDTAPDAAQRAWSDDCDPLDEHMCALPWPSNLYLAPDSTRATGYTLSFGPTSLPQSTFHTNVDPTVLRRLDGYGVSVPIMVIFPNVDISMMATEDHIDRSMDPNAPALLFEVHGTTLTRVPYFVELDSQESDPSARILFLRPAVILQEATRYIVAFRNLRDTSGSAIAPSRAFTMLRDHMSDSVPSLARRQARFDEVFGLLESQAIQRSTLTLAWDFNTASDAALHGRLLHMRDDALATNSGHGAQLTVTNVVQYVPMADGSGHMVDSDIALEIQGTMTVPSYLVPRMWLSYHGVQLNLDASGQPMAMGTVTRPFWVRIPYSALARPAVAHALMQYGHGLLGQGTEFRGGYLGRFANQYHYILFAANLTGMCVNDVPYVLDSLNDVNNFVSIADGLHQGLVEWVMLARAMRDQLSTLPDVMSRGIVVDSAHVYYSGNSQGGIFGGTYMAVSPDIQRGHLGVPGNNYSLLLDRSADFTHFLATLMDRYPNVEDDQAGIGMLQLLWDFTDPVSYLRHIHAQPFPVGTAMGTPHEVILTPAKGDHQVSPLTNEILARTTDIGIAMMAHYDNQRMPWNVMQAAYPRTGSGVVLYDYGNPWPQTGNHPPMDSLPDPHGLPRAQAQEQNQVDHFFHTGEIMDVCNGMGCRFMCDSSGCHPLF